MAFIKENHIFLNQQLQTQEDVFHFLAKKSTELEVAQDAQEVFDKLNEREQEGTTGMMNGFAIPHAKAATIQQAAIIIVTLDQGVEWQSLDNQLTGAVYSRCRSWHDTFEITLFRCAPPIKRRSYFWTETSKFAS